MSTCYDCGQNECRCKGSASLPEVLAAVTLGPEDRLLVVLPKGADLRQMNETAKVAAAVFGDLRVAIAAGIEDVIVLRATKAEGSTVGQCGDEHTETFVEFAARSEKRTKRTVTRLCHLAYGQHRKALRR